MSGEATSMTPVGTPSAWFARFLGGIRNGGLVLDVACGRGRHLRAALAAGYRVVGVDRDLRGVEDLCGAAGAELVEMDLESGAACPLGQRFAAGQFDGVIVTNYLWRPVLADIVSMVRDDGLLIYETFAVGNERVGLGKPSNTDFLLRPGELLEVIRPRLVAMAYEHVTIGFDEAEPGARASVVQRIVAVGPGHPFIVDPPKFPHPVGQHVPLQSRRDMEPRG